MDQEVPDGPGPCFGEPQAALAALLPIRKALSLDSKPRIFLQEQGKLLQEGISAGIYGGTFRLEDDFYWAPASFLIHPGPSGRAEALINGIGYAVPVAVRPLGRLSGDRLGSEIPVSGSEGNDRKGQPTKKEHIEKMSLHDVPPEDLKDH